MNDFLTIFSAVACAYLFCHVATTVFYYFAADWLLKLVVAKFTESLGDKFTESLGTNNPEDAAHRARDNEVASYDVQECEAVITHEHTPGTVTFQRCGLVAFLRKSGKVRCASHLED